MTILSIGKLLWSIILFLIGVIGIFYTIIVFIIFIQMIYSWIRANIEHSLEDKSADITVENLLCMIIILVVMGFISVSALTTSIDIENGFLKTIIGAISNG